VTTEPSAFNTNTNETDTTELRRPIIDGLSLVDNGNVVKRIQYLRDKYEIISPDEMHLLVDPTDVGSIAEAKFARKAIRLEGWRNALVLFPLMVTWFSLGLAAIAYAQSIAINAKLVAQPFLKQWAEGFPAITTISFGFLQIPLTLKGFRLFTFGEIALLDFVLLLILLFITLRVQQMELRARNKAAEITEWLEEELYELSKESLVRSLGPGPNNKQPVWAIEVHAAINQLSNVLTEVKSIVMSFGSVIQTQQAAVDRLIENTVRVASAVDNLNTIYQRGKETYDNLDAIMPLIETHFNNFATSQDQAVNRLNTISTDIRRTTDAITAISQPFSQAGLAQLTHQAAIRMQRISEEQLRIQISLDQQKADMANPTITEKKARWWDLNRLWRK
jgi:hypothetical protein